MTVSMTKEPPFLRSTPGGIGMPSVLLAIAFGMPWGIQALHHDDVPSPAPAIKPILAPFAILPHHLEVSFKTCHAVYLRDPVARPGHSEVISPFDLPVHERAYMYYIRRGK